MSWLRRKAAAWKLSRVICSDRFWIPGHRDFLWLMENFCSVAQPALCIDISFLFKSGTPAPTSTEGCGLVVQFRLCWGCRCQCFSWWPCRLWSCDKHCVHYECNTCFTFFLSVSLSHEDRACLRILCEAERFALAVTVKRVGVFRTSSGHCNCAHCQICGCLTSRDHSRYYFVIFTV